MNQKALPRLTLALGLAILLTGLAACRKDTPDAGQTAATPTATAAQPGQATPVPGQPAAPAGQPGDNAPLTPDKIPGVVAKVNGEDIKKDDLIKGAQLVRYQLTRMGQPVSLTTGFYRQVLQEMIGLVLLQQEAKSQGVTPTEDEIQKVLASRKSSYPTEAAYQQALQRNGLTEEDLRRQARDQIAVQKFVETKVAPGVTVSDQATREFYEKNKSQIRPPERIHVRHILVRVDASAPAADRQKAREKAAGLLKQLQDGADFAKLAMENSEDPGSKDKGGDVGWLTRGRTDPTFERAAFALTKPNELSPLVESQFGYHLLQFVERESPPTLPYEQVKDRLGPIVRQQQVNAMVQQRIQTLRTKGKIEVFL